MNERVTLKNVNMIQLIFIKTFKTQINNKMWILFLPLRMTKNINKLIKIVNMCIYLQYIHIFVYCAIKKKQKISHHNW